MDKAKYLADLVALVMACDSVESCDRCNLFDAKHCRCMISDTLQEANENKEAMSQIAKLRTKPRSEKTLSKLGLKEYRGK